MRTWIESGLGNHCMRCFIVAAGGLAPDETRLGGVDCLPSSLGLDIAVAHGCASCDRAP
ncbi:MAG TPA: hypothetical protein VLB89_09135 [Gaiellaceae bacterium]|nr:hypothetical protein [Gaiellaceae bacterium]